MSTKEQLHRLVDELDDEQVSQLLHLAEELYTPHERSQLPAFVGRVRAATATSVAAPKTSCVRSWAAQRQMSG